MMNITTKLTPETKIQESSLKEELQKKIDLKKKEKIKFIASIVLSNLFVAILMWDAPVAQDDTLPSKIIHEAHSIIEMPIETYIEEEALQREETPVTLLTKDSKLIAKKAYIHHQIYKADKLRVFKIEISHKDLKTLGEKINEEVIALPYVEQNAKISTGTNNYEYSF